MQSKNVITIVQAMTNNYNLCEVHAMTNNYNLCVVCIDYNYWNTEVGRAL